MKTRFPVFRSSKILVVAVIAACLGTQCGYTLQSSRSPLLEKENIRRIYVYPLTNNTYKAGVENLVYNSLIRTLATGRRVALVQHPEDADAFLRGSVTAAQSVPSAATTADKLTPSGLGLSNAIKVATVYSASLACEFSLIRRVAKPGQRGTIWSSSFSRNKSFPASNQLDVPGTTTALINDSEFDRAISDLAESMMGDVHESMLAMF